MAKISPEVIQNSIEFNNRALIGIEKYEKRMRRCVCAILAKNKQSEFEPIGSGVLVNYRNSSFIFSSAHVIEKRKPSEIYVLIEDDIFEIEGLACTTHPNPLNSHKDDRLDCLVIKILSKLPLNITEGFIGQNEMKSPSINCVYLAAGFPLNNGSKNGRSFTIKSTFLLDDNEKIALDLHKTSNVAVYYDENSIANGRIIKHKSLKGISGGALFMLHGISSHVKEPLMDIIRLDLVAIIVERRKRTTKSRPALICTSVGCHLSLADQILDEFSSSISHSFSYPYSLKRPEAPSLIRPYRKSW